MPEEYRNIYKTARKAAGLTQEAAAERLGISVESLRAYETGQRVPSGDVVDLMMICFNALHLGVQHLHETNPVYARIVPALEQRSMLEAAVRVYLILNRFAAKHSVERPMEIAEDGKIDQTERPEFDAIMADLREIVKSGLELEVYCGERSE